MDKIELSKQERAALVSHIRRYCADELDHEIGGLEAELFLDFLSDAMGPAFYNRGLSDAEAVMAKKMDDFSDALRMMERSPPSIR